ncbi:NAC domain-containing protein 82-like isoform X1 [Apium graveolens]|uniref:NAC domain-containing protein 82-like isoform X1 n=1 Tax=Apium graveolens TaxID=4045 RepID=UPI003D790A57
MARFPLPLPPGFRFHPTDVELIMYYLKRKVTGKKLVFDALTELNIYKFAPWDLPEKCLLKSKDLEWYFFCPKQKKYSSGARSNRATENGYWKITGTDKLVTINQRTVGTRKTLIFYKGQPPKGERTDWVMHEYSLGDKKLAGVVQDAYVICKIYQKGGLGPKNGAQYGALFNEEEWDDIDELFVESQLVAHQISFENVPPNDINNIDAVNLSAPRDLLVNFVPKPDSSICVPQNTVMQPGKNEICVGPSAADPYILTDYVPPGTIGSSACMTTPGNPVPWSTSTVGPLVTDISPDIDVLSLLNMFTENMDMPPVENNPTEFEMNGNDIYKDLGDLNDWMELNDTEFDIPTEVAANDVNPMLMGDSASYLELNDLSTPLGFLSEAGPVDGLRSGSIYAGPTYDMRIGLYKLYSGVANPYPAENVSGFDEYSAVLQEPHLLENNIIKELEKDHCNSNFEAPGFDAVGGCEVPFVITEPEGSNAAEENPRRGEQQTNLQLVLESVSFRIGADSFHYSSSSISLKAEVTLNVGECTKTLCYVIWRSLPLHLCLGVVSLSGMWRVEC